jgi:ABC-type glycerol-3-phosphate transport system substrate-binding protein
MKTTIIFFFLLALLCLAGCGNADPVGRDPGSAPVTTSDAVGGSIHIVFKWPGDDFASRQELEIRDKIARTIEERGIGTVTRVGTGMGTMEIVVKVRQKEAARSEIEAIIRKIAPDMKSYIR